MAEATTDAPATSAGDNEDGGAGDERLAFRGPIQQLLTRPEIGALIGLVSVWLLFWLAAQTFGTVGGTANYMDVAAILGIMAVPVALLMIGGEFDLSSGSMTGATAIVVVLLSKELGEFGGAGLNLHLAIPLGLAFALIVGWFNGTMVERTSLPSFIVTLGTFFILIGAKLGFTKLFTEKVIAEGLDEADGYTFWNNIFGAAWIRNGHAWDGRDWAWAALLIAGGVGLLLATFELSFKRRPHANAAGVPVFVAGLAAGILGFVLLLTQDGGDVVWGGLVGLGVLVGAAGWCLWRYDRAAPVSGRLDRRVPRLAVGGVACVVVAMVVAAVMDAFNEDALGFLSDSNSRAIFFLGIGAAGILAFAAATGHIGAGWPLAGLGVAAVPAVSFLVTVQAARALLFVGLGVAGVLVLSNAARRARASSSTLGLGLSLLTALAIAALAFFIRSEGSSRKIRVELTTSILLIALVVAAMAVATFLSAQRTSLAPHAHLERWTRAATFAGAAAFVVFLVGELFDIGPALVDTYENEGIAFALVVSLAKAGIVAFVVYAIGVTYRLLFTGDEGIGRPLVTVSATAAALGLAAKLLFITVAEAEATQAVTRFRVSVLYYLAFAAIGTWLLARTQFGSWTFAVGGNKDASRSVGVPAARTKTTLFMMVSAAAFVTGMVTAFRLNSVQSNVGDGSEFRYIIVAVVGGNLLTGGYGSAAGAAIGALIWGMITQGIGFAQWNTDWRFLVLGFLLLVAVIVNNYVRARAEKSH